MRIGLLASSHPNRERSLQALELFKHLKPAKTLILNDGEKDILDLFPLTGGVSVTDEIKPNNIEWLTDDVDIVITIDTDFCGGLLYRTAKRKKVKSVLMYNFDQLEQAMNPNLDLPDMLLACSKWHFEDVKKAFKNVTRVEYLPFPVSRDIKFARRKKARNFIHITGDDFLDDQNGTEIFIKALFSVRSDIRVKIYAQRAITGQLFPANNNGNPAHGLKIERKPLAYLKSFFFGADVLVLPRRFGGLSVIANEAMAAGVIPLMPNVDPQNEYLSPLMLTPIRGIGMAQRKTTFEKFDIDPVTIAMHMDHLAKSSHLVAGELSDYCDVYATFISWENYLPKYIKLFESLLEKK